MSRIYDNWEKLVGAVLRREKDRQLAYCESFDSSSSAGLSSRSSFSDQSDVPSENNLFSCDLKATEYEEIRKATRNFEPDSIMWEGTYSFVYKGWIDDYNLVAMNAGDGTAVAVAVMKMDEIKSINTQQWMDQINHLRHPNLVTPIGYCFDTDGMVLVYDFMDKARLDDHLFTTNGQPLSWATRIKVAIGAARGLGFLHGLDKPLLYGFLESADILLYSDFNAKLSDISLRERTSFPNPDPSNYWVATSPFYAPEYIKGGSWSTKSDVYRFGVVLFELIAGRRAFDRRTQEIDLIHCARLNLELQTGLSNLESKRGLSQIMDSRLEGQYPREQALKVARLALLCVGLDPESRPSMRSVVSVLQTLPST